MLPLEALRGVLAIVVVAHHFVQSFLPWLQTPNLRELGPVWLVGTPLELFLNGPAAVVVFYAITGFVLTVRGFGDEDVRHAPAAVKRWPRLAGPVLVAVMLSYVLFVTGAYRHHEVGALNHSVFITTFFDQLGASPPGTIFEPSIWGALFEGSIGTFLFQGRTYDPVIWMIHVEWVGSLLALAFAADLRGAVRSRLTRFPLRIALVVLGVAHFPFFGGVVIARQFALGRLRVQRWSAVMLAVSAVYLLGAASPWGVYSWIGSGPGGPAFVLEREAVHSVGALLLLTVIVGTEWPWTFFKGRASRLLGTMSFPLYLVHLLVFGSVGARTYLAMNDLGASLTLTVLVTLLVTLAACAPLVWAFATFDRWWVGRVNRTVERLWPARAPRGVGVRSSAEVAAAGD